MCCNELYFRLISSALGCFYLLFASRCRHCSGFTRLHHVVLHVCTTYVTYKNLITDARVDQGGISPHIYVASIISVKRESIIHAIVL